MNSDNELAYPCLSAFICGSRRILRVSAVMSSFDPSQQARYRPQREPHQPFGGVVAVEAAMGHWSLSLRDCLLAGIPAKVAEFRDPWAGSPCH
jgi:hypothetical protein